MGIFRSKHSIGTRLIGGFAVLTVLMAFFAFWGHQQISLVAEMMSRNTTVHSELRYIAAKLRLECAAVANLAEQCLAAGAPEEARRLATRLLDRVQVLREYGRQLPEFFPVHYGLAKEGERARWREMGRVLQDFIDQADQFARYELLENRPNRLGDVHDEVQRSHARMIERLVDIENRETSSLYRSQDDARKAVVRARILAVSFVLLALVGGMGLGWIITRSITHPIKRLADAAQSMTQGDFNVKLAPHPGGEMGILSRAFENMGYRLHELVTDLQQRLIQLRATQDKLRISEEHYRGFFSRVPIGVYRTTPDGRIVEANPAAAATLGCETVDQLLSIPVRDLYADPAVRESWRERVEQGRVQGFEMEMRRPDGRLIWIKNSAHCIRNENGTVLFYEGTIEDISEAKRIQRDKAELERKLLQSQKLETIGTLAGGIAHDFNNILTPIFGYAQLALRELGPTSRSRNWLESIASSASRARDLAQQILTFARQVDQERKAMNLVPALEESLHLLRATLPATIELQTLIAENPVMVLADGTQVHQVIMNLCTNAAQAMENARGCIQVSLRVVEKKALNPAWNESDHDRFAELQVKDDGRGMSQETLERAFDPFFTTKTPGEGTGLGLSVAHGIILDHGGRIHVDSAPGQGSTFTVHLPLVVSAPVSAEMETHSPPAGHEHVLFVDDEDAITLMAEEMLSALGYKVTTFSDCPTALAWLSQHGSQVDLVITDQTLPRMTGTQFARQLQQILPQLPVILVSGLDQQHRAKDNRGLGIRAFVNKPFTLRDLGFTIRQVLDESSKNGTPSSNLGS